MSEVREILRAQRQQFAARLDQLSEKAETLRASLVAVLDEMKAAVEEVKKLDAVIKAFDDATTKEAIRPTIIQAVLEVLKQNPEGLTALQILAKINEKYFDGKIVRTSLSPQLSRLKDRDHKIELRGNRWFLAPEKPSLFNRRV